MQRWAKTVGLAEQLPIADIPSIGAHWFKDQLDELRELRASNEPHLVRLVGSCGILTDA